MIMRLLSAACVLIALAMSPVHAVQPDEVLKNPELEARARALSAGLRCLVCQNQSIDDSDAPLAKDLRILLRKRLEAGDSDAEVVSHLVNVYGEFVLLKPRFGWHTLLLWLGPFLLLLAGLGVIWSMHRKPAVVATERELTADETRELERMLKDRDGKE